MSKVKKLYNISEEAVQKLEMLQHNNPDLSTSAIVEALIMTAPNDIVINLKTKVEYSIT